MQGPTENPNTLQDSYRRTLFGPAAPIPSSPLAPPPALPAPPASAPPPANAPFKMMKTEEADN